MTSEKEQFYFQRIAELEAQLKQRDERIAALEQAYNELLEYLPYEATLNVDETGHKENGDRFWTWCFRADA